MSTSRDILRLGTRGSLLARMQSQMIADLLMPFFPGQIVLEIITTTGDRQQSGSLAASGGKGLFVKEIEEALLDGRIDFAVHSAKDMPAEIPAGLMIGCTPLREAPNDVWIGHEGKSIAQLAPGALVGTSSQRRQAQLLALRRDLKVTVLRGNIDTRLRKVAEAQDGIQGTFLAAAGLARADIVPAHAEVLPTDKFIPAAGQGTLALECRAEDAVVQALLANLHDEQTAAALAFERGIVQAFAGSCLAPIGVCAEPRGMATGNGSTEGWIVRGIIATPDGRDSARAALLSDDASRAGLEKLHDPLVKALESRGARAILASI